MKYSVIAHDKIQLESLIRLKKRYQDRVQTGIRGVIDCRRWLYHQNVSGVMLIRHSASLWRPLRGWVYENRLLPGRRVLSPLKRVPPTIPHPTHAACLQMLRNMLGIFLEKPWAKGCTVDSTVNRISVALNTAATGQTRLFGAVTALFWWWSVSCGRLCGGEPSVTPVLPCAKVSP